MATIRLEKAIVNINDSKTVIQHHPLSVGSVPTTLEKPYSITLLFYHITSENRTYVLLSFNILKILKID